MIFIEIDSGAGKTDRWIYGHVRTGRSTWMVSCAWRNKSFYRSEFIGLVCIRTILAQIIRAAGWLSDIFSQERISVKVRHAVIYLKADKIVNVVDLDSTSIVLSHRLTPLNAPPLEKGTPAYLSLQEILIIGNCHEQVSLHGCTI